MTSTTDNALRRALADKLSGDVALTLTHFGCGSINTKRHGLTDKELALIRETLVPHPQGADDWRAGIEAAAKWHDSQADLFFENKSNIAARNGMQHLRFAQDIRNLQPPVSVEATGAGREEWGHGQALGRHIERTMKHDQPASLQKRPVAWRVKDFADGCIIFQDEAKAYHEATESGALMQGLYVRDGTPHDQPGSPEREEWKLDKAISAFCDAWPSFKNWWTSQDDGYNVKFGVQDIPPEPFEAFLASLRTTPAPSEVERLRRDCAELYQVIGTMAEHCQDPEDPAIIKALDNASDAANGDPRRHDDLLPFVLPAPPADSGNADDSLYLERWRVRGIIIGVADEHVHVAKGILADIDQLPIFTRKDRHFGR